MRYLVISSMMALLPFSMLLSQEYQAFPKASAEWEVIRCFYFFQPGWHDIYKISMDGQDTLYQGESYKKLYITQHLKHGPSFDSIYPVEFFGGIREENKQIYIFQKWASVDTTEHLIYDFTNTELGDTIYTSCLAGTSDILLEHLVIASDSVLIGEKYHKRIMLQDLYNSLNTEYWIEGVGSSWGLPFASFWSITDNSYDLSCYYQDFGFKYSNPDPQFSYCLAPLPEINCDTLQSFVEDVSDNFETTVYPNPFSSNLKIQLEYRENWHVLIYDIQGAIRTQFRFDGDETELNLSDLNNGLYILKCVSKTAQTKAIVIKNNY